MKKSALPFFAAALTAVISGGLLGLEFFYPYALICLAAFAVFCKKTSVNVNAAALMLAMSAAGFVMLFFGINKEESAALFAKQCAFFSFFMLFSAASDREKAFFAFMDGILCGALYCFAVNFAALLMGILPVTDGRRAFALVINYPNALAALFGVSFLWCVGRKKAIYVIFALICAAGLLLTYCKAAVFTVLLLTAVFMLLSGKKIQGIAVFVLCAAAAAVFAARGMSFSSLLERTLYYRDATSVFASYPFGCGGGGWSSVYTKFQSGFYAVKSVHSSFFAAMTDFGIVGIVLFLCAAAFFVRLYQRARRKNKNASDRIFLTASFLFLHSLVDCDADFPLFVFIFTACGCMLSYYCGDERELVLPCGAKAAAWVLCAALLPMSLSYGFYAGGIASLSRGEDSAASFETAAKLNPISSSALYMLGGITENTEKLEAAAAYDPMNAKYYAALCNVTSGEKRLENARKLCELQPLAAEHYELLSELLKENGDYDELSKLSDTFDSVKKRINPITYSLHPDIKFEKSKKFIENTGGNR